LHLKCDGTRAENRFRLSAKRTRLFKSAGRQFILLLAAEVCASAVVMLDTPCSEVVCRVLATHSIRQFSLHFPSRASPCAITFQLGCTYSYLKFLKTILNPTQFSFGLLENYTMPGYDCKIAIILYHCYRWHQYLAVQHNTL